MKNTAIIILCVLVCASFSALRAQENPQDALKKARQLQQEGRTEEAIGLLEKAYAGEPQHLEICATLGFYKGMMAGKTQDFMEAGKWVGEAFTLLDKAVAMAPDSPLPRFYRGILSINTPEFLGKWDQGISDLELLVKLAEKSPRQSRNELLGPGLLHLARGYEKRKEFSKALDTYTKARPLAGPGEMKSRISASIENLKKKITDQKSRPVSFAAAEKGKSMDPATALNAARDLINAKEWEKARALLKTLLEKEPGNLAALKTQLRVVGELAGKGYDENVYHDTDYRTNLAFEVVRLMEKLCELEPENIEMRLQKGTVNVEMPFFVNRLDQGIKDLNMVLEGESSDAQKARALYYLGKAHQKKMTTYWIKVAKKYRGTRAAGEVFKSLRPAMQRLDPAKLTTPCVTIDFVLGFRDELAPQTAVWIEDADGEFVKTIYVSGFCGFAKEKQVDLPQWGKKSEFRDVDGVTGASIDRGHHIYVWDLKDFNGQTVKPGEYRVRVETHFWPSGLYQRTEARIQVGSDKDSAVTEKGNMIPYLQVDFHPAEQ